MRQEKEGKKEAQTRKKLRDANPARHDIDPGGHRGGSDVEADKRPELKMSYGDVKKMFKRTKQAAAGVVGGAVGAPLGATAEGTEGKAAETPKAGRGDSASSGTSSMIGTQVRIRGCAPFSKHRDAFNLERGSALYAGVPPGLPDCGKERGEGGGGWGGLAGSTSWCGTVKTQWAALLTLCGSNFAKDVP